jgi:DNA replication protein DnaC
MDDKPTPAEQFMQECDDLGLDGNFLLSYFLGGTDEEFGKAHRDRPSFIDERKRWQGTGAKMPEGDDRPIWMPREVDPEQTLGSHEWENLYRSAFGASKDDSLLSRPYHSAYGADQRRALLEWGTEALDGPQSAQLKCFLAGPSQRGKSHTLRFFGAHAIKLGATIAYENMDSLCDLAERLQAARDREAYEHHMGRIDRLKRATFAILDDLGQEPRRYRDRIEGFLYSVLEYRNQRNRPTAMASNHTVQQISEIYNERVLGRINARGVRFIVFDLPDYETWSSQTKEDL